jgi:hypothetical protein
MEVNCPFCGVGSSPREHDDCLTRLTDEIGKALEVIKDEETEDGGPESFSTAELVRQESKLNDIWSRVEAYMEWCKERQKEYETKSNHAYSAMRPLKPVVNQVRGIIRQRYEDVG